MKPDFNNIQERQKLDFLFREISIVEESGVPREEFDKMLTRYSEALIHTIERLFDTGGQRMITELLIKKILKNLQTPVCLLDHRKEIDRKSVV